MALIKCPECGKEISDKSNKCIHCGFPLDEYIHDKDMSVTPKSVTIVAGETGKSTTMGTQKILAKSIVIGVIICIAFALIFMSMSNYSMKKTAKRVCK